MQPHRPLLRHLVRLGAPALALALALALFVQAPTRAFGTTGHQLSLAERHFRIYNNFEDPTANDNVTPDPNFPGASGAVMAIWKASVEWGSGLHGNGEGDLHQPGDLGSGGANFDASFQGLATSPNALGGNVHSALSGGGAGVYAYAEIGTAGGWRIRYYEAWTWDDSPSKIIGGVDLQSVATHEYGHALGLSHSATLDATMMSTLTQGNATRRSIEPDDVAGLQAVYGAAAASKPRITGLVQLETKLKIQGANFAAEGNEVWFTGANPDGAPVVVGGLPSPAGGALFLDVPSTALPGDVLVRTPGESFQALSNAWPLDPTQPLPCRITKYGLASGNPLGLSSTGQPALGQALAFQLAGAPAGTAALTVFSAAPHNKPLLGGTQLVDPYQTLLWGLDTLASSPAQLQFQIPAVPSLAGLHVFGQSLALDPAKPSGVALSNGIEVVLCQP